jgi:GNAT superfamily N-acetyltransferase
VVKGKDLYCQRMKIRNATEKDIAGLTSAFLNTVWRTPESYFQKLVSEQEKDKITLLVAYADDTIAGFVYVKWQADYPPLAEKAIPEIRDLRVLEQFRRGGIASALMDEAERLIFRRSKIAGLGVGLYADYGPAQRMYIQRGYVPDGRGIHYNNRPVSPGHNVMVDDNLLLYFTKERPH